MLPEIKIDHIPFKYKCPKCKRGAEAALQYATLLANSAALSKLEYEKKVFCSNRYCESQHHFKYTVSAQKGSDELKVKVSKFFVDNEEGKVQVLA